MKRINFENFKSLIPTPDDSRCRLYESRVTENTQPCSETVALWVASKVREGDGRRDKPIPTCELCIRYFLKRGLTWVRIELVIAKVKSWND